MALVAAWWGIWDIIAGLAVAQWWGMRTGAPRPSRSRSRDGRPGHRRQRLPRLLGRPGPRRRRPARGQRRPARSRRPWVAGVEHVVMDVTAPAAVDAAFAGRTRRRRRAPRLDRHARQGLLARPGVRRRRHRHPARARRVPGPRGAPDRRLLQRRGVRLPPGQPRVAQRGRPGAGQRGVRLQPPQAARRGDARRAARQPPRARAGRAPDRHDPRGAGRQPDHRAVRAAAAAQDPGLVLAVRLHLGRPTSWRSSAAPSPVRSRASSTSPATGRSPSTRSPPASASRCSRSPSRSCGSGCGSAGGSGSRPYGPEQTIFLKHRPVLANDRLKAVFGYTPSKTSAEAFDAWRLASASRRPR